MDNNEKQKPKNYWTKERAIALAKKYTNKKGFREAEGSLYSTIFKNGWQNDALAHMPKRTKSNPYKWSRENCEKTVAKYKTLAEFIENDN